MTDNSASASTSERPLFAFWTALESIIRPTPQSLKSANQQTDVECAEKLLPRLRSTESLQARLKSFEEVIRLGELSNLSESFLSSVLLMTRDLFKIEFTPIEYRRVAFNCLMQLYQKQVEKFETFLLKNHLLSLIISNDANSKCLFLYTILPVGTGITGKCQFFYFNL